MRYLAILLMLLAGCEQVCDTEQGGSRMIEQTGDRALFVYSVEAYRDMWYPGCTWTGEVEWLDQESFMCGSREAGGCFYYDECPQRITIGYGYGTSALWHELGHACGALPFD